jgi:hypothetical protein
MSSLVPEKPPKALHLYEVIYAVWEGENLSPTTNQRFIVASSQAAAASCVRQKLYAADSNVEIEIQDVIDRLPVDHIAYGSL